MKRINKKKFFRGITIIAIGLTILTSLAVDFIRFTECYVPTWKYQLENDIRRQDERAIDFYEDTYVKNNRDLFNDDFAIRNIYIEGDR